MIMGPKGRPRKKEEEQQQQQEIVPDADEEVLRSSYLVIVTHPSAGLATQQHRNPLQ
jgi:hypothetical protein